MGAHRWTQKQVLYEESVKVPFIVRPPGGMEGHVNEEALVSGLDLVPTIMDYAGVAVPDELYGNSVKPIVDDPEWDGGHEFVVSETTFGTGNGDFGVRGRMLRTDRYKYIVYNKGKHREQLFDMENDPGEMVNLAGEEQYQEELDRHRKLLRDWIDQTDDFFDHVPHR